MNSPQTISAHQPVSQNPRRSRSSLARIGVIAGINAVIFVASVLIAMFTPFDDESMRRVVAFAILFSFATCLGCAYAAGIVLWTTLVRERTDRLLAEQSEHELKVSLPQVCSQALRIVVRSKVFQDDVLQRLGPTQSGLQSANDFETILVPAIERRLSQNVIQEAADLVDLPVNM